MNKKELRILIDNYLRKIDSLTTIDNQFLKENDQLKQIKSENEREIGAETAEILKLKETITELRKELGLVTEQLKSTKNNLNTTTNDLSAAVSDNKRLKSRILTLQDSLADFKAQLLQMTSQLESERSIRSELLRKMTAVRDSIRNSIVSGSGTVSKAATPADAQIESVRIGNQVWMKKNLNVSKFRNGDAIPEVQDAAAWAQAGGAGQPAWCYYENNPANGAKYGKLYNWLAVSDPRGLCPSGWHVPTDAEWTRLTDHLGGESVAGSKMKSTSGWEPYGGKSGNGSNESGFSGLPGGYRYLTTMVGYNLIRNDGYWWSSSESSSYIAWFRNLNHMVGSVERDDGGEQFGFSVRCLRD